MPPELLTVPQPTGVTDRLKSPPELPVGDPHALERVVSELTGNVRLHERDVGHLIGSPSTPCTEGMVILSGSEFGLRCNPDIEGRRMTRANGQMGVY